MDLILSFGTFVFLICLGLFVGRNVERRHLKQLAQREARFKGMHVTQVGTFPNAVPGDRPPMLLLGDVVIATDYLKSFLAALRNLFGGEVRSYQLMVDRARREALLRILEKAHERGYNAVCNVRLELVDIGGAASSGQKKNVMAAVQASGTAYYANSTPE